LEIASKFSQPPTARAVSSEELEFQKILKKAEAKGEVLVHRSKTSDFAVVELKNRYERC
jgi:hypothetical protein